MATEHVLASAGSAIGNLMLFLGVSLSWPQMSECTWGTCLYSKPAPVMMEAIPFRPFIDDVARREFVVPDGPNCPAPELVGHSLVLEESPLPPEFDPHAFPGEKLIACILVGSGGELADVRLIGVRDRPLARRISARIRGAWRLSRGFRDEGAPGWLRVRLNADRVDPAAVRFDPA